MFKHANRPRGPSKWVWHQLKLKSRSRYVGIDCSGGDPAMLLVVASCMPKMHWLHSRFFLVSSVESKDRKADLSPCTMMRSDQAVFVIFFEGLCFILSLFALDHWHRLAPKLNSWNFLKHFEAPCVLEEDDEYEEHHARTRMKQIK